MNILDAGVCQIIWNKMVPGSSKWTRQVGLVLAITALIIGLSACVRYTPKGVDVSPQGWENEFNIADRRVADTGHSTERCTII